MFGGILTVLPLMMIGCDRESGGEADRGDAAQSAAAGPAKRLRLVYPEWSSEIASAHLFQAVLQERMGYRVETVPVPVEKMWQEVASGEADVLTGAWLPTTHRDYYREYREELDDAGANLTGARIGLLVPTVKPGRQTGDAGRTARQLVTIRSIEELGNTAVRKRFDGRIVGIESSAGVVGRTREALDAYGLKRDYRLVETDEERMIDRVADAVNEGEWIVFTGWKPHRIFESYSLRFLEDPKNVFGGEESIHTMVRSGLEQDMPAAYTVLSRISYEPEDLERLMRWIHDNGRDEAYEQAVRWIRMHPGMVDAWVKGQE